MVNVFHNKNFRAYSGSHAPIPSAQDLVLTAQVATTDLEQAFQLTNNLEDSWTTNEGVEAFGSSRRSTSVGDVMQQEDGSLFMVAWLGFKPLEGVILDAEKIH